MVQVLEPFKERNSHTTSIDVQIWNHQNVAFDKDFISSWGGWTVGGFSDDLRKIIVLIPGSLFAWTSATYLSLNFASIFTGDNLFNGGWHENIARFVHQALALVSGSAWESNDGSFLITVIFQLL